MDVVQACCAGLDVHKRTVVACVLQVQPDGGVVRQVRTFGTMTAELLALDDWLTTRGVEHVALESTGVYWRRCIPCWKRDGRSCWSIRSI